MYQELREKLKHRFSTGLRGNAHILCNREESRYVIRTNKKEQSFHYKTLVLIIISLQRTKKYLIKLKNSIRHIHFPNIKNR